MVTLVREIAGRVCLPKIQHVYTPKPQPDPDRDAEFGLIGLSDGSTGFFFAWLDNTLERLQHSFDDIQRLVGSDPIEAASLFESVDQLERTVGLGAISAISQHVFKMSRYALGSTTNSMGQQAYTLQDRVGLVGFFPSLVERLRHQGVSLVVIEQRPELVQKAEKFEVTLDSSVLSNCSKVLCTASVLLNDTLDEILSQCKNAQNVTIIGPMAGCLPDPLFERGVDIVGGSVVTDLDELLDRLKNGQPWGDAVNKYVIRKTDYPGAYKLLESLAIWR